MKRQPLRLLAAAAAVALAGARDAGALERPRVAVAFDASGSTQITGLSAADRDALAVHVVEQVRAACAKAWRFLAWEAAPPGAAPTGAAWEWQVRVDEQSRTITLLSGQTTTDSMVRLQHLVRPGGTTPWWTLDTGPTTLYDWGAPKSASRNRIQQAIDDRIGAQLTAGFFDRAGAEFIKKVQIGDKIVVQQDKGVIVPLRRCELAAGEDSALRVTFKAKQGLTLGSVDLAKLHDVEDGAQAGFIYGQANLDFPPDTATGVYWDPKLARLGEVENVRVFMLKYDPDEAPGILVSDGLVLDAAPCVVQP